MDCPVPSDAYSTLVSFFAAWSSRTSVVPITAPTVSSICSAVAFVEHALSTASFTPLPRNRSRSSEPGTGCANPSLSRRRMPSSLACPLKWTTSMSALPSAIFKSSGCAAGNNIRSTSRPFRLLRRVRSSSPSSSRSSHFGFAEINSIRIPTIRSAMALVCRPEKAVWARIFFWFVPGSH